MHAREKYVERMGGALTDAGLARLPSRVFAALTVDEDGRMTSAEIAEALGISAASVSSAIKVLTHISFVHRERERGSRRDVYVVDDDAWLRAMMQQDTTYRPMLVALEDGIAGLPAHSPARHRLVMMREFLLFMEAEIEGIARRWRTRQRQLERELTRS